MDLLDLKHSHKQAKNQGSYRITATNKCNIAMTEAKAHECTYHSPSIRRMSKNITFEMQIHSYEITVQNIHDHAIFFYFIATRFVVIFVFFLVSSFWFFNCYSVVIVGLHSVFFRVELP